VRRLLAVVLLAVGLSPVGPVRDAAAAPAPCAAAPKPTTYDHVVIVWLENRSYDDVVRSPSWDAVRRLARQCAAATRWSGVTHPSLPNYLAAASGSTGGVTSDCGPLQCPQSRPSVYGTATRTGVGWRTYAGGLTSVGCARSPHGRYAPKHVAVAYFADAAKRCRAALVPITRLPSDLARDRLPGLVEVVPDLCDDGHDCTSSHADDVAGRIIQRVVATRSYREGRTALIVTFDEGTGGRAGQRCSAEDRSCHVVFVAASRSVRPGTAPTMRADHRQLARLTEDLLGMPHLATTRAMPSRRGAFGL
jgi:hypothetical protein